MLVFFQFYKKTFWWHYKVIINLDTAELDNMFVHLVNVSIQKFNENYSARVEDLVTFVIKHNKIAKKRNEFSKKSK